MKSFYSKSIILLLSIGSYLAALFRRKDKIVSYTTTGFPLLDGWTESPEEKIIERFRTLRQKGLPPLKAALFCIDGAQEGEVLPLRRSVETLGPSVVHSVVVTPRSERSDHFYQASLSQRPRLMAEAGQTFLLNGREERDAELYDFDQVSFLGNRFLVMDLTSLKTPTVEEML